MQGSYYGFDPFDAATIRDPYPSYTWLRDEAPVFHHGEYQMWTLSRYEDVLWAARNHEVFSSAGGIGYEFRPVPMMIATDPPEHTRLRRIAQRDFVPKVIEKRWHRLVEDLVDELLGGFVERGGGDWVSEVAYLLPVRVIADILGVPASDRERFKSWSDTTLDLLAAGQLTEDEYWSAETAAWDFARYLNEQFDLRETHPSDDLLGLLLEPHSGELLTRQEMVAFAMLLLIAGHETTTNMIGSMVELFVQHPDQWERLKSEPGLVGDAIEEIVRLESPIQGFFRNTLAPAERHGVTIPTGEKVMLLFGAANRDPRHFDDPERFDVGRPQGNHLAFGAGIHLCLGAPVARLEGRLLLEAMLGRIERFEAAGDVERRRNPLLRGPSRLPVRVY